MTGHQPVSVPPASIDNWDRAGDWTWRSGPWVIVEQPPSQGDHESTWTAKYDQLGEGRLVIDRDYPSAATAITACRMVAAALIGARDL